MEGRRLVRRAREDHRTREVESPVAAGAAGTLREEELHAPTLLAVESLPLVPEDPAVVGRASRDQRALEARQGLGDVLHPYGPSLAREGGTEPVHRLGIPFEAPFDASWRSAHLDRRDGEERHRELLFQAHQIGPRPGQGCVVGDVGQGHGAARVLDPRPSHRASPAVGEGELLAMAGGTGHVAAARQPLVVEEASPQSDLGRSHWVVRRHTRHREAGGQAPDERRVPGEPDRRTHGTARAGSEAERSAPGEDEPQGPPYQPDATAPRSAVCAAARSRSSTHRAKSSTVAASSPCASARRCSTQRFIAVISSSAEGRSVRRSSM